MNRFHASLVPHHVYSGNQFHESGLLTQTPTYKFKYIGKGYYRKAFVVNFTVPGEDEVDSLVFKIFRDSEHELNKKSLGKF